MIKPGDLIKHKNFKDVAIQVFYTRYNAINEITEIDGVWINLGQAESYPITTEEHPVGFPANIMIRSSNLQDWLKCTKVESKFYRNEKWESFK